MTSMPANVRIIGNPSPKDQAWVWNKEAKPVTGGGWAAGKDPEELAALADLVDNRTAARELDELEAELVAAFDAADDAGDVDLMQRLADALDEVRATRGSPVR